MSPKMALGIKHVTQTPPIPSKRIKDSFVYNIIKDQLDSWLATDENLTF